MSKHGKKYMQSVKNLDLTKRYSFDDALNFVIDSSFVKFDETVDIAVRLGVDPRHADQMVRGSVVLPEGLGKSIKVLVFAKGEKEAEAEEAGADFVGNDDLIKKIQSGWFGFDKVVATPDMMGSVGKIGKLLGPRGLMPNVKVGSVTFDVERVIKELKFGKIDFRVEKTGIVHSPMGKVSFGTQRLLDNIRTFLATLIKLKPSVSKGAYVRTITMSSTMGPGIKIDVAEVASLIK